MANGAQARAARLEVHDADGRGRRPVTAISFNGHRGNSEMNETDELAQLGARRRKLPMSMKLDINFSG